jgi:hypothetical protein
MKELWQYKSPSHRMTNNERIEEKSCLVRKYKLRLLAYDKYRGGNNKLCRVEIQVPLNSSSGTGINIHDLCHVTNKCGFRDIKLLLCWL